MSGEMMLAIGYGAILVASGALVWWGVNRFYGE